MKKSLYLLALLISFSLFGQKITFKKDSFGKVIATDDRGNKIATGEKDFFGDFVWKDHNRNIISKKSLDYLGKDILEDGNNKLISKGEKDFFGNYKVKDEKGNIIATYNKNFFGEIEEKDGDGRIVGKYKLNKDGSVEYNKTTTRTSKRSKKHQVYIPLKIEKSKDNSTQNKYSVYAPRITKNFSYNISDGLAEISKSLSSISLDRRLRRQYYSGLLGKTIKAIDKNIIVIPDKLINYLFLNIKRTMISGMKDDHYSLEKGFIKPRKYEKILAENYKQLRIANIMLGQISNYKERINKSILDQKLKTEFEYRFEMTILSLRPWFSYYNNNNKSCKSCTRTVVTHESLLYQGRRETELSLLYDLIMSSIIGDYGKYRKDNIVAHDYINEYRDSVFESRKLFLSTLNSKKIKNFEKSQKKLLKKGGYKGWKYDFRYSDYYDSKENGTYFGWQGSYPFEKLKKLKLIEGHMNNYKKKN
jgi:hypothetical protein|tara:strand:- start:36 stop:1460 length:1425 start_codon:yes stop_codon:yes gene_type:complete